jgi:hypothetical protein
LKNWGAKMSLFGHGRRQYFRKENGNELICLNEREGYGNWNLWHRRKEGNQTIEEGSDPVTEEDIFDALKQLFEKKRIIK